jgi:hypothetical protein
MSTGKFFSFFFKLKQSLIKNQNKSQGKHPNPNCVTPAQGSSLAVLGVA